MMWTSRRVPSNISELATNEHIAGLHQFSTQVKLQSERCDELEASMETTAMPNGRSGPHTSVTSSIEESRPNATRISEDAEGSSAVEYVSTACEIGVSLHEFTSRSDMTCWI